MDRERGVLFRRKAELIITLTRGPAQVHLCTCIHLALRIVGAEGPGSRDMADHMGSSKSHRAALTELWGAGDRKGRSVVLQLVGLGLLSKKYNRLMWNH